MSSTSNNAAVTGNDAVDDVMATSQSAENGTSHDTADGDIKNDVLSSFISIGRIMAYRAIHRRLVSPGAKSPRGEHAFDPRRGQGRVLATLRESDQTSQKDLAAMFGMSRQAMAELLKKLEASGHISRRPSRRDSRVMMVSLTRPPPCWTVSMKPSYKPYTATCSASSTPPPTTYRPRPPRMSKSVSCLSNTSSAGECRPTAHSLRTARTTCGRISMRPHNSPAAQSSSRPYKHTRFTICTTSCTKPYFEMRYFAPKPHFEMRHSAHTRQKMLLP